MANSLRELHQFVRDQAREQGLSRGVTLFAVGWIFYDLFERADHEEKQNGCAVTTTDLDRYVRETAVTKVLRDLDQSQSEFGRDAYDFMEEEIRRQVQVGIDQSILAQIRGYTTGWKAFGMNVLAGLVSGVLFAAITFGGYLYVRADPSMSGMGKGFVESPAQTWQDRK